MEYILTQIFLGIIFLILALFTFTFPSLLLVNKLGDLEEPLERYVFSTVVGIVIFTLFAYFLAFLNLRFLMWLFPVIGIYSFIRNKKQFLNFKLNISAKKWFLLVLMLGVLGQVSINAPSGISGKEGITFWSSHGHDGVWHLALMQQMQKNVFPFPNPEFSNQKLQNYHFFVDLLMSDFGRLYKFSNLDIYFRFMPIVFSIMLGLSGFILGRLWAKSELVGIWSMFFIYFTGSFGYIVTLIKSGTIGGESTFWVTQTQSVLGNPPHAAAFIIVLGFLFCLLKYLKSRNIKYFLIAALLGGCVIEFKVYAGILIISGLLVLGLFELLIKRKITSLLLFLTTLVIAFVIYYPNSSNSQDFLIWQPWWYIRTMVVAPDRLGWLDMELRRQTYIAEDNLKRVIQLELTALLIFLVGNLGMRFIGFWTIFKQSIKKTIFEPFNLFFLTITSVSFLVPVFFLQKGVAWNSIQFNQYFLLLFGFYAAISAVDILNISKKTFWKIAVCISLVAFSIPSQVGLIWQFYSRPPLSKISYEELEALNFLKNNSKHDALILTPPFDKGLKDSYNKLPLPIYAWYDTGYIPAFAQRSTFLSDEEQIHIMGYQISELLKEKKEIFESQDPSLMNNFVKKYNINYVYLTKDQKMATTSSLLKPVFRNEGATIFKVEE